MNCNHDRRTLPTAGALLLVLGAATATAAAQGSATTETARGLHTTTFRTGEGTVDVHLPGDLAAGDTISGTVAPHDNQEP